MLWVIPLQMPSKSEEVLAKDQGNPEWKIENGSDEYQWKA